MYYYICPKIGTGTSSDPYRPDVDTETSFVGQIGLDDKFLILTPTLQSPKIGRFLLPPIQQLQDACTARGIDFDDVTNNWFIQ